MEIDSPMKNKSLWRLWSKSIGEKASQCDKESDKIAVIRTVIFLTYLITNAFIVAGVIRHWNSETIQIEIHEIPSSLSKTKKEDVLQTSGNISYNRRCRILGTDRKATGM
jgi:hypothetical protein